MKMLVACSVRSIIAVTSEATWRCSRCGDLADNENETHGGKAINS